ncbi:mandelate racemase/muconate lactonizing enzyme family protein, partial [Corallococcus exiguus]|uniref:enolase C-terminal domain-like protein n=1 Tax=Corallococcus exiguus TaxID=83462 RepID=UPI001836226B
SEMMKVAAMASAWHLKIAPHTSASALSTAASVHVLSALPNGHIYEADVSRINAFRDELSSEPFRIKDGFIRASDRPGLGIEVDESIIERYPLILGASYQ